MAKRFSGWSLVGKALGVAAVIALAFAYSHEGRGGGSGAPSINGPRIVGSTPGRPFLFLIPVTGEGTLSFGAADLPEGLSLDSSTGIISEIWGHHTQLSPYLFKHHFRCWSPGRFNGLPSGASF